MQALAFTLMRKQRLTSTFCITIITIRPLCPCLKGGKYTVKGREEIFLWCKSWQCCWSHRAVLCHLPGLTCPPAYASTMGWPQKPPRCSTLAGWRQKVMGQVSFATGTQGHACVPTLLLLLQPLWERRGHEGCTISLLPARRLARIL